MRNLWIELLTLLARSLQSWSEAVTRRLEKVKHSASDQPSGEVDGLPTDWLERVKSAQSPTQWRARVQQGGSDSIERAVVQGESTPADRPIAPQQSEDYAAVAPSQPNYRAADTTRPEPPLTSSQMINPSRPPARDQLVASAKSTAARSQFSPVNPNAALQPTNHVAASEAKLVTPEVDATAPVDEVIAARSQTPVSPRERRHLTPTQLIDDTRAPSTTTEHGGDDQTSAERFADAERDVPEPDQSQRVARSQSQPAPRTQSAAPVDVMSAIESHADQVAVVSSPTTSPHRSDFAVDDRVAVSWPSGNTLRSSHAWATIAGQGFAEYESSVIENRWPALPPERITVDEDFETVLRERERLRRLDLEQRGLAWSA